MSCRAGGRVAETTATAISNPPKAAAAASLTDRLMSVPGPEAAETLAALGLGRGIARGLDRLRAALRRNGGGQIGQLLGLQSQ